MSRKTEPKTPWGYEHAEAIAREQNEAKSADASAALQVEMLERMSGRWRDMVMRAYEQHFDVIWRKEIVEPSAERVRESGYIFPSTEIRVVRSTRRREVTMYFQQDEWRDGQQYSMRVIVDERATYYSHVREKYQRDLYRAIYEPQRKRALAKEYNDLSRDERIMVERALRYKLRLDGFSRPRHIANGLVSKGWLETPDEMDFMPPEYPTEKAIDLLRFGVVRR